MCIKNLTCLFALTLSVMNMWAMGDEGDNENTDQSMGMEPVCSADNAQVELDTCLWFLSALLGNLTDLQGYLDQGMDINTRDSDGATALHLAAHTGNVAAVEFLLRNDANALIVDHEGDLPIHYAVRVQSVAGSHLLLQHRPATANTGNQRGITPIQLVSDTLNLSLTQVFLDNFEGFVGRGLVLLLERLLSDARTPQSCQVLRNFVDGLDRVSLSLIAQQAIVDDLYQVLEYLLDFGLDPNTMIAGVGGTLLHSAAFNAQAEIVILLLRYGADPEILDSRDNLPIHLAIQSQDFGTNFGDDDLDALEADIDTIIEHLQGRVPITAHAENEDDESAVSLAIEYNSSRHILETLTATGMGGFRFSSLNGTSYLSLAISQENLVATHFMISREAALTDSDLQALMAWYSRWQAGRRSDNDVQSVLWGEVSGFLLRRAQAQIDQQVNESDALPALPAPQEVWDQVVPLSFMVQ